MAEIRPIFPAHAVERCAITLSFLPELPTKPFEKLIKSAETLSASHGLVPTPRPPAFNIDAATGQLTTVQVGGPSILASPDGQTQLVIVPNAITWQTTQYVRWATFKSQMDGLIQPLLNEYMNIVELGTAKVEYWDRFIWTGDWNDLDVSQLLKDGNDFVPTRVKSALKEWHAHSGWFDFEDSFRRLTNVNIDVVGLIREGVHRPTIGIYTMMQDQAAENKLSEFGSTPAEARLDDLHDRLKDLLSQIIIPEVCQTIGLQKKGRRQ
ncbi:uncharacterized protein (TIGR04255 family) [Rhizobium sp. BK529]|uniref:TIGR04255 family protein n=1 Tax=Rhizobium sp. BK529 TaxID=2586983 RepID=UPI0016099E84|nr:TIGR04255 family protein [Rhizobium sp. BK529]MBB3594347.1 uncharacterized protein (TIGR04255 family) [Rhizobium sp. BK529]